MKTPLIALIFLVGSGFSQFPAVAASSMDGLADYQAGRYRQAAIKLARATGASPADAIAHYYLANSLVKCGEHEEAAREYRISYMLQPHGQISEYCRTALKGYKRSIPDADEIKIFNDTIRGATASAGKQTVTVDSEANQALSLIRRQVDYERRKNQYVGQSYASSIMKSSERQARDVDAYAKAHIEAIRNTPRDPRSNSVAFENELKAREDAVARAAKDEQEQVRREARQKADRYLKVAEMRQRALDEVANNLESQMLEKPSAGGVKLVAKGTDLYVRNYAFASGPRALPDAHGAVVRIYGRGHETQAAAADGTSVQGEGQAALHSRHVRGKVID